jgi:pimeloyl-ACP methyl ester carboxylesterase
MKLPTNRAATPGVHQSGNGPHGHPLSAKCDPPSGDAHQLTNTDTDIAEITTVVNYIRNLPGRETVHKVSLVGYSLGAAAVGPFTLRNLAHVDRLFLLAPIFRPGGPSAPEAPPPLDGTFSDPQYQPRQFGYPMNLQDRSAFFRSWQKEVDGHGDAGAKRDTTTMPDDFVWDAIMGNDDIGRGWGTAGVLRFRNHYWWGWNTAAAGIFIPGSPHHPLGVPVLGGLVPVMIVYGSADIQANHDPDPTHPIPNFRLSVPDLYDAIPGDHKLMVQIPKTGHFMPWETSRKVLHRYSADWIKFGSVKQGGPLPSGGIHRRISQGSYKLTSLGVLTPVPA